MLTEDERAAVLNILENVLMHGVRLTNLSDADAMKFKEDAFLCAKAANRLSAPPSAGEWKLVPIEPTREMWAASVAALAKRHDLVSDAVWRAMLDAAPPAPKGPSHEL